MIGDEVTNYGRRTIGPTTVLTVTDAGVAHEFIKQGRWEIHNTGANPCALLMTKDDTISVVFANDRLLPDMTTAEHLAMTHVDIGMEDVKKHKKANGFLQAITGAGLTTELRLTLVTKR